jgi:penicillin-binding protein 1A
LEANPSLALGTSEVSLIELVSAYAPFANGGAAVAPHVVERVRNHGGKVLFQRMPHSLGRVVEPQHVAMMNAMMRETLTIGTAQRAQPGPWPAAGKTGTSQDFRDAWFIGYTGHLVTGVWLGNDDAAPTRKLTGSSLPIDIWNAVMRRGHQGVAVAALPGLPQWPSFASAVAGDIAVPPAPEQPRPAPIDRNLDAWFFERLDRLLGRR